jgi:hypothetical protein
MVDVSFSAVSFHAKIFLTLKTKQKKTKQTPQNSWGWPGNEGVHTFGSALD